MENMKTIIENYFWDKPNSEWKSIFWFLEQNMKRQEKGEKWIQTNFSEFKHERKHLDTYLRDGCYENEN